MIDLVVIGTVVIVVVVVVLAAQVAMIEVAESMADVMADTMAVVAEVIVDEDVVVESFAIFSTTVFRTGAVIATTESVFWIETIMARDFFLGRVDSETGTGLSFLTVVDLFFELGSGICTDTKTRSDSERGLSGSFTRAGGRSGSMSARVAEAFPDRDFRRRDFSG